MLEDCDFTLSCLQSGVMFSFEFRGYRHLGFGQFPLLFQNE